MEFSIDEHAPNGSADSYLSDDGVRAVWSLFGDKCLETYRTDIRTKKAMHNGRTLRQVKSFVGEYGVDDALHVVDKLFSSPYNGAYRGETVGTSIFGKSRRWLAEKLLLEYDRDSKYTQNGVIEW